MRDGILTDPSFGVDRSIQRDIKSLEQALDQCKLNEGDQAFGYFIQPDNKDRIDKQEQRKDDQEHQIISVFS